MTEIERLEQENKRLRGKLEYLRSRCVPGAEKYFDTCQGLIKIVPIKADLTPKEQMELRNIRKRVETQREEIKKLQASLDRHKAYTKELEQLVNQMLGTSEYYTYYNAQYQRIQHMA